MTCSISYLCKPMKPGPITFCPLVWAPSGINSSLSLHSEKAKWLITLYILPVFLLLWICSTKVAATSQPLWPYGHQEASAAWNVASTRPESKPTALSCRFFPTVHSTTGSLPPVLRCRPVVSGGSRPTGFRLEMKLRARAWKQVYGGIVSLRGLYKPL